MVRAPRWCLHFLSALLILVASECVAQRMVSVAAREVNLRSGPGTQHPVEWLLSRGYPLRVIGSQGSWLRVIDFENDKGWVYRPLTSSTPHHIVKVKSANMRAEPTTSSRIIARLVRGDVLRTLTQKGGWVRVQRESGLRGWVARRLLWGW
jgi:SH3-like domain-containing protein